MPSPDESLGFLDAVLGGVLDAFEPLLQAAEDPIVFFALMAELGWIPPRSEVDSGAFGAIGAIATAATDVRSALDAYRMTGTIEESKLAGLSADVADVIDAIATLADQSTAGLPAPLSDPDFWAAVANELAAFLLTRYLRRYHPIVHALFRLFGILDLEPPATANAARIEGHLVDTIRWDRLGTLFSNPTALMTDVYGWGVALKHDALVRRLKDCLVPLGVDAFRRYPQQELLDRHYGAGTAVPQDLTVLRVPLFLGETADPYVELGFEIFPVPAAAGSPTPVGLMFSPYGSVALTTQVDITETVSLTFAGSADGSGAIGAIVRPGHVEAFADVGGLSGDLALQLAYTPLVPKVLVGDPTKTGVSIAGAGLGLELVLQGAAIDEAIAKILIHSLKISIDFGDGDGFLAKILHGVKGGAEIDGALGWSSKRGVVIEGAVGLELTIPLDLELGPLTLSTLTVGARLSTAAPEVTVAIAASLEIGPIAASVDGVGVRMVLEPSPSGAAFGLKPVFAFKPPAGLGLAVAAGPVGGGGYVYFDTELEQYAGIIQLSFEILSVTAIGLLTTRMPDGSKGFSLLVIIAAQFPPIQLGYGFSLNGVGGLVGINRTMVTDVLRDGIRHRTLDSIMFPPDPIRNAPQIVSDLRAVFPPAEGRYTFGPMVIIAWGSSILKLELGLILELPSPIRLVILGKIILALPVEGEDALLQLRLDVIGILDFDRKEVSIDASLVDSRIVVFAITGDMALRASWGPAPMFALAAGGFHPHFPAPPGFPPLERLAISLAGSDNPRVRLEAYFALTANTIQLGARADLYAEVNLGKVIGTFSVTAYVGFDTLIHLSPFEFEAGLGAEVTIARNGSPLISAKFVATLTGPSPWHAWGYAEFDFFGSHRVQFDATIGPGDQPAIAPVAVLPKLITALKDHASWAGVLPQGATMMVSLREAKATAEIRVHPLGSLTLRQRIVPLGKTISAFGSSRPADANRFELTTVTVGGTAVAEREVVFDQFAPAQFERLTDDQKLARPSFEQMEAGLHLDTSRVKAPVAVEVTLDYEQAIVDVDPQTALKEVRLASRSTFALPSDQLEALAHAGAAGHATAGMTGAARYAGPPRIVRVIGPRYVAAAADTLVPLGDECLSYAAGTEDAPQETPIGGKVVVVRTEEAR